MTWIFMILKLRPHPKSALYVWTQSECFYSGEIDEFVEKELLPDAAETMNALSEAEKNSR